MLQMLYAVLNHGVLSFFGQRLIDASDEFFDATYNCKWYEQSEKFKKTFRDIRANAIDGMSIRAGGFCTLNYANFVKVKQI